MDEFGFFGVAEEFFQASGELAGWVGFAAAAEEVRKKWNGHEANCSRHKESFFCDGFSEVVQSAKIWLKMGWMLVPNNLLKK